MKLHQVIRTGICVLGFMFLSAMGHEEVVNKELISGEINWRYQDATTLETTSQKLTVPTKNERHATNSGVVVTDAVLEKTLLVKDMVTVFKKHLANYNQCHEYIIHKPDWPIYHADKDFAGIVEIDRCYLETKDAEGAVIIDPYIYKCPVRKNSCTEHRTRVAGELESDLRAVEKSVYGLPNNLVSDKLLDTMDLAKKLVQNMKDKASQSPWYDDDFLEADFSGGALPSRSIASGAMSKGLTVTAGGAQDFGFIKKLIEDGRVPAADAITVEGFFSEFDLSPQMQACSQLICMETAVAYDLEKSKMYVQLSMNSNVTAETFSRKQANIALVIDISGSMSATDNTEKSRLEWAKDAALKTIDELNDDDFLSIVVFDTESQVLLSASAMNADGKSQAKDVVSKLVTQGSTNLEAGLRDGYTQVAKLWNSGLENRVILISDAGLNTGVTEESSLLKLVTDNAQDKIGLTAIGLGLNFNQNFIHNITQSRGGNYVFVQSGKAMYKFFENFDFLVTPVAYSFRASLDMEKATLAQTYGIPMPAESVGGSAHELLSVETLFFAGSGGGAILLEYDLN